MEHDGLGRRCAKPVRPIEHVPRKRKWIFRMHGIVLTTKKRQAEWVMGIVKYYVVVRHEN